MREWLWADIVQARVELAAAYLFGSSIYSGRRPRDIDVVLIAPGKAGETQWSRAIEYRDALKVRFDDVFNIPLSAAVLSVSEWAEFDGVVVRERVQIF